MPQKSGKKKKIKKFLKFLQPFRVLKSIIGEKTNYTLLERMTISMKKTLGLVLTAAMVLSTAAFAESVPAVPENATIGEDIVITRQDINKSYNANLQASMVISETGDDYIVAKTDDGQEIQLNISDETVLIDSELAAPFSLSDLKVGDKIYAEYSSVMTRSLPPQTSAAMIAVNVEKGGGVSLINVNKVETDNDGNLTVYDNEKDIVLTVGKDASVKPYMTKNIVKLQDITVGSKILAWYDIVTLSIPAQAYTDKVVAVSIPDTADGSSFTLVVGDKTLDITEKPYYEGNTLMVPLRKIGEALGYKVGWDEKSGAITIEDSSIQKATLYDGTKDVVFDGKLSAIDMSRKVENTVCTTVNDGCTFVPLDFFKEFLNDTSVKGMTVTVAPSTASIDSIATK